MVYTPAEFRHIFERLEDTNEKMDVKFTPIRYCIVQSQLGDLARYISHDPHPEINPHHPRPHGSRSDEVATFGHALANIVLLAQNRGITAGMLWAALHDAVKARDDKEWEKRRPRGEDIVVGSVINPTTNLKLMGMTVYTEDTITSGTKPGVLVVEHFRPEHTELFFKSNILAVITDHGGMLCHAATIARERKKVAIVGTGNATKLLEGVKKVDIDLGVSETGLVTVIE